MAYILPFLIGVIAGLRALTPVAVVSWAARLGTLNLGGTWLAFMGYAVTPYILTALAAVELVTDKLPKTPNRTVPPQFGARILMGSVSGAALGMAGPGWIVGLILGAVGAVAGTLGGSAMRGALARAIRKDLPAALIEDVIAVAGAILIVSRV